MKTIKKWLWDLRCNLNLRVRVTTVFHNGQSLATRGRIIKKYLASNKICKAQIGCGPNRLEGWLNADLVASRGVIHLDATKPFPFPDDSLDYIFTEHMIGSLDYLGAMRFFRETHRTLKTGGRIRVSTPDIQFLIRLYNEADTDLVQRYIKFAVDSFIFEPKIYTPANVINNFFHDWGIRVIYDFEMLHHALRNAGFTEIIRQKPLESSDPQLRGIESHGRLIGEEFNLLESLVVEAQKAGGTTQF